MPKRPASSPPLPGERHERFAQELAQGRPAAEAYRLAGYQKAHAKQAASRLAGSRAVRARVAAIRTETDAGAKLTRGRALEILASIAEWGARDSDRIAACKVAGTYGPLVEAIRRITYGLSALDESKPSLPPA